jgi:hypothetical protein
MLRPHRSTRRPVALVVIAALTFAVTAAVRPDDSAPTPRPPASCATSEFRQFDFFAGDWDTYNQARGTEPGDVGACCC